VEDPAAFVGPEAEQRALFRDSYFALARRIEQFIGLPLDTLDRVSLQTRLEEIGESGSP
jgi:arsenate reductase